jgi:TPR repeat protein
VEARRTTPTERTAEDDTQSERTPATASPANGGEELAVAQRYLRGVGGQRRDAAEAAKWLWKSIAKHNSEATLLLADLYLKGDGVSKNCDQARVLLDSAARKGMAGAGERLRNLQAFGCQ